MAAIQRQRPNDREAWDLARHHFGCARETAASLQSKAQVRARRNGDRVPSLISFSVSHAAGKSSIIDLRDAAHYVIFPWAFQGPGESIASCNMGHSIKDYSWQKPIDPRLRKRSLSL